MRKLQMALLAFGAMLLLIGTLALGAPARANGLVHIQDDANVLSAADEQQITAAAQSAPFAVTVWTNSSYNTKDDFYNAVRGMVGNDTVVLGVDPVHKWSHISAKQDTGLTADQVNAAASQANTQFGNGAWAAGFTSAINSMAAVAPAGGTSGNTAPAQQPAPAPSGGGGFGLLACLIPIVLIVLAFFFLRNRMGGNRATPAIAPNQPYVPPQQGGYPPQQGGYPPQQGGYPPQQGGYYPPQQGGGIGGNIASGGLGALAGGAIGYELGRHAGENQGGQAGVQPGYAPDFGGGGGGIIDSASGGTGADFGGSGADFGGGASFGGGGADAGGGGADFGGGGDTGGGDIV
jgi:hypothetical protein